VSQSAASQPVSNPSPGPSASAPLITPEGLEAFDEAQVEILARRLEEDDYATPFDGLHDWHLLRSLAIHRPELVTAYVHLVDQEPFDED
jgi:hypothetical protein